MKSKEEKKTKTRIINWSFCRIELHLHVTIKDEKENVFRSLLKYILLYGSMIATIFVAIFDLIEKFK